MSRSLLRYIFTGLAGACAGAVFLLVLLRWSPIASDLLLEKEKRFSESKPIPLALDLNKDKEAEETQVAPSSPLAEDEEDGFFSAFSHFRKMEEEMEKEMLAMRSGAVAIQGNARQQITKKEDDQSVTYEVSGAENSSLSTSVQSGYLTITGEARKQMGHASFRSKFTQTFSLPEDVDPTKMETISEKDKVLLRFPKRKT